MRMTVWAVSDNFKAVIDITKSKLCVIKQNSGRSSAKIRWQSCPPDQEHNFKSIQPVLIAKQWAQKESIPQSLQKKLNQCNLR